MNPTPDDLARELAADRRLADRTNWTLIGTGGFGVVFRVERSDLGRTEAVKVLRRPLDTQAADRFRTEGRLMGAIGPHPHLVTVYDAGVLTSGRPYVVTEYVAGGSLEQVLRDRGPLPLDEALRMTAGIAAGLQRCHDNGVLHLDIKPANVLIDAAAQPRLTDFGVSRSRVDTGAETGEPERAELLEATVAYSPPELLQGDARPESDVYMLAATLHALITGRPPYPRPADLRAAGVEPAAARVVEGALDLDPERRPGRPAEFAAALEAAAIDSTKPDEPPDRRAASDGRGRGQRRWAMAAGLAAIVAVVAILAAVLVARDRAESDRVVAVSLERAEERGADPFSASSVAGPPRSVSIPEAVRVTLAANPGTSATIKGTDPGLYGGTGDGGACDIDAQAAALMADPDKAAAFAGVVGVDVDAVADFLRSLAPVVLQTDTWVTNHGYRDGRAVPRSSVLEAGTAVLVDRVGLPRVRCGCGNPLTPAADDGKRNLEQRIGDGRVELTGPAWGGFDPAAVVTITPGAEEVDSLEVNDLERGGMRDQPFGADAAQMPLDFIVRELECGRDGPVTLVDGAAEGDERGINWSVRISDRRALEGDRWLAVLACIGGATQTTSMHVVLVETSEGSSGRVIDEEPAGFWSGEAPEWEGNARIRITTVGAGPAVEPSSFIERPFEVAGDRIEALTGLERLPANDSSSLLQLRELCATLDPFPADELIPIAGGYVSRDAAGSATVVLYDSLEGGTAFRLDGGRWLRNDGAAPTSQIVLGLNFIGTTGGKPLTCVTNDAGQAVPGD